VFERRASEPGTPSFTKKKTSGQGKKGMGGGGKKKGHKKFRSRNVKEKKKKGLIETDGEGASEEQH